MTMPLFDADKFDEAKVPTRHPTSLSDYAKTRLLIDALAKCSFVPGTVAKRFVRDTHARMVRDGEKFTLTEKGRKFLFACAWTYRRQLPKSLVAFVEVETGGKGIKDYRR